MKPNTSGRTRNHDRQFPEQPATVFRNIGADGVLFTDVIFKQVFYGFFENLDNKYVTIKFRWLNFIVWPVLKTI